MPITPRLRTIRRPPPDAGTLTAMIKAALTKSWNLTKAPQRGHGRVARRWLRTRVCSAHMRGGKESRIWFQPLRTCVSSTLPAWSSKKDPVNKATGVPETLDLLHQQFSDTAENKPLEGYVVDVKDSFVKVTGVSSASIGGTVTFENGMKGLVVSLETNTIGVVLLRHKNKAQNVSISTGYYNDNNMIAMKINDKLDAETVTLDAEKAIEPLTFPVGSNLVGQVVDPLGYPVHIPSIYNEDDGVVNESEVFIGDSGSMPIIQQRVVPSSTWHSLNPPSKLFF